MFGFKTQNDRLIESLEKTNDWLTHKAIDLKTQNDFLKQRNHDLAIQLSALQEEFEIMKEKIREIAELNT